MNCPVCGNEGNKEKEYFDPWIVQFWCEVCDEYFSFSGYEIKTNNLFKRPIFRVLFLFFISPLKNLKKHFLPTGGGDLS